MGKAGGVGRGGGGGCGGGDAVIPSRAGFLASGLARQLCNTNSKMKPRLKCY